MTTVAIYGLFDPRNGQCRYIGATRTNPEQRLGEHIRHSFRTDRPTTHKMAWVKSLAKVGLSPEIDVLETVDDSVWQREETFYINYFRYIGCDLTNTRGGGEGLIDPSPELRMTMGSKHTRANLSPTTRKKMSDSARIRATKFWSGPLADIRRQSVSEKNRNKVFDDTYRDRLHVGAKRMWTRRRVAMQVRMVENGQTTLPWKGGM